MGTLSVLRLDASAEELAACSLAWRADIGADARLVVGVPRSEAIAIGAFQRTSELGPGGTIVRRGSGGAAARISPGTVWAQLALARPDALVECSADKLLNRYVRPLLRALTRASGVPASYFGRDWVSARRHPIALLAFAHEARTGRALVEAIVAVDAPFALAERASFLGQSPATLAGLAGRSLDPANVAEAIAGAYRALAQAEVATPSQPAVALAETQAPAWTATVEEAIGTLAAGPDATGRVRIGGELMVSVDAIARLEDLVASLPPGADTDAIGRAVDDALAGAVVFGVRSYASIRDVIVRARQNMA